ncbi:uncharacterized protein EDB91DRAFT_1350621 [Suillus paluster]|uniref:uncharacterized protein n=1 Tax=Suillus paluster TaxID=48578 RepID=UPI001B86FA4F|nr:uncharacterized protein EDB91DRAFT_1350621 [Suillus paluster]KAG1725893.1 hypothetical protein EDB91DRAFT_1350621 [Suillus paluster]
MRRFLLNGVCPKFTQHRPNSHPSVRPVLSTWLYTTMTQEATQADDLPHFIFAEEPLGIPAEEAFEAKLGFGTISSLWLARDLRHDHYVALKILNGYANQLNRENKFQELKVLQPLSSDTSGSFARLLTHFYRQGIEADGEHLCLVMELLGPDIQGIRASMPNYGYLPLLVIWSAVSLSVMIFEFTTEAIAEWLKANPPLTLAGGKFALADRGSGTSSQTVLGGCVAQFDNRQTTDDITPLGLGPPEIFLAGEWDESVDIWTFGCIVLNALTSRPLFKPTTYEERDLSEGTCYCIR